MAGNRSITVTLRANVQDFKSQFDAATKAAENTAKATEQSAKKADTAMGQMVQSAKSSQAEWTTAGTALTAFGAATLGGLGLAVKAAMDWESAFAGVRKTVDASEAEFAALEQGLRSMARELPASHTEIAAVAEAAGQLGIATPNILGFTRTMVDMGVATNLSSEEAATSLARFMNVMGTSQSDVGRLGAAVVGLGNNFATTESEIVEMSQRLAGAGAQAGLTEGDVMGIATAMSSVGIEAEAGGSAMSQTMKRIGKAVDEGGESLSLFGQVAGMTAEEFSAAWREDPAMALDAFITGLSSVESQGMTTNGVLSELGITGIRESDALLRLSAAAGQGADGMSLLATAVQMGNGEFDKGSALMEEAAQRYETAESKIQMAKNALVDAGISIGGVVLPAIADLAGRVGDLAGWFADLPGPVHGAIGALGGIAGAGALAAGSFLLIFPRVMDTVSAFKTLKSDMPGVASGLSKVGSAAAVAAGAIAVLNVAGSVTESFRDGAEQAELLAAQLLNMSAAGEVTADSINGLVSSTVPFGVSVHGIGDALSLIDTDPVSAGIEGLTKTLLGVPTTVDVATESLGSLDGALVNLVNGGYMEEFSNAFAQAVKDAEAYGYTAEDLIEQLPGLKEALTPIATEMGLTADNATLAKLALEGIDPAVLAAASGMDEGTVAAEALAGGMAEVESETESATEQLENMLDSLIEMGNLFIDAERGAMDYADALKEAGEAAKENGKHWEDGTEAAAANKDELLSLAEQALKTADAFAYENESGTFLQQAREDLIDVAAEMMGSREEAEAYVDQLLGTPEEIQTIIDLETQVAKDEWRDLWDEIGHHPPEVPVTADTDPAKGEVQQFSGTLGDMPPGAVPVDADTDQAERKVNTFGQKVGETPTGDVPIDADTSPAEEQLHIFGSRAGDVSATVIIDADTYYGEDQLRQFQSAINEAGGSVTINGETMNGQQALSALVAEVNAGEGYVDINGTPVNAESALLMLVDHINNSGGTVTIDGDKVPAQLKTGEVKRQIDGTEGTVTIDGNNDPANRATDSAKRHADGTTGTIDVNANTGGAESSINSTARNRSSTITASAATWSAENQLNWLARNRTSTITVRTSGAGGGVKAQLAYASGGPVYGPGTGTSDSIDAKLSNNEHVVTAGEVKAAGGHQAIYSLRQQLLAGAKTLHLATGGGVENGSIAPVRYTPVMQQQPGLPVSASVDTGAIASAVAGAISAYEPIVAIGDREFVGVMRRAGRLGAR
ncbi:phage tail tape measure protein [Brachybacterium paraconglomeratum]